MERIKRSLKVVGIALILFIPIGFIAGEIKSARIHRRYLEMQEHRAQREMKKAAILREAEKDTKVKEESAEEPAGSDD